MLVTVARSVPRALRCARALCNLAEIAAPNCKLHAAPVGNGIAIALTVIVALAVPAAGKLAELAVMALIVTLAGSGGIIARAIVAALKLAIRA